MINTENAWLHSLDRVIARLYAHSGGASEAETELDAGVRWSRPMIEKDAAFRRLVG